MPLDLLIRGARVADGTGLPAFAADVGLKDGAIVEIGRISARARRVIDADGLVVTPGFIDPHTHYDAQLFFEPTASPATWHGVTTVVTGNCGFSIAPAKPEDVPFLLAMLSRVEGMSVDALSAGVTFGGGEVGQFLADLDGRIGVNVAALVGHSAVRRFVMGEAASSRSATDDEIARMQSLVRASLDQGALGFGTSQLDFHAGHLGRPVPSNLATEREMVELSAALADYPNGILQVFCRSIRHGYSAEDQSLLTKMSIASGNKPMSLSNLRHTESAPHAWECTLGFIEQAWSQGRRMYPFLVANPFDAYFRLDTTFLFDDVPTFRRALTRPARERLDLLRDPGIREEIRAEFGGKLGPLSFAWNWDRVVVQETTKPNDALVGRTIASIAAERNVDPVETLIDVALADDLLTLFRMENEETGPESRAVTESLMRKPYVLVGGSDGGAHLLTFCGADYTTRFLNWAVPNTLTFEEAVSRLTMVPATILGFHDRGIVREGAAADLVVMDPSALAVKPPRFVRDFPAGAERLVIGATGYHHVVVGGDVLLEDGQATGVLSGKVIRRAGQRSKGYEAMEGSA